ncbi:FAD-dependent oxidoreductase [Salinarimonas rosea]|uniref:FAD-dependent oxidoreductase n=1 Tax=Salinarimonas rosea TaxID=552063 RepID=UPI00040E9212|nr:FAD-binding protein [Salinarimonas rosea]
MTVAMAPGVVPAPWVEGKGEPDLSVDVLVIGAGGAGLVAALAAAEAGADVAVVEKGERLAGNTALSSGSIPAAGTRFQHAAGVSDDPARFAADLRRVGGPHDADHLVDVLAGVSGPLVEWLVDVAAVRLTLVETYRHVGHSVNRLHAPPSRKGADLLRDLERAVAERAVPVALGNACVALFTDGDGAVCGARTRTRDGAGADIAARAVVLATNGFGANPALKARFCPQAANLAHAGAGTSEGEAILWGEALGARLANVGAFQGHSALAQPHGSLVTWTVVEKGGIVVDETGRRFADETLGYSAFVAPLVTAGGRAILVYDRRIRDMTAEGQEEFAELVHAGGAIEAPDLETLADRLGLDPVALAQSVADAGAAARGEAADSFGRTSFGIGPLQAPFVATRIAPALFHTQGGLAVDAQARVVGADGAPIRGLWAAGGAAAGVSGRDGPGGYVSGNGLLAALGLGLVAGRAGAGAALDNREIRHIG